DAMSFVTNYAELTKQSPEVPVPTYPANGATGVSVDAVLMWEHDGIASADTYDLEWSLIGSLTGSVHKVSGIGAKACNIAGLPIGATVYWHVKAVNAYGNSAWSAVKSFVTTADTLIYSDPEELTFSMAADDATPDKKSLTVFTGQDMSEEWTVTVNGDWMTATPASGTFADAKVFTVEVSVSPLGLIVGENYVGAVVVALASGSSQIAIPVYLKVTEPVGGGDGGDGGSTDLLPPSLVSPADGQGGLDMEPYLIWSAATNATSYVVQVGRDSAFTMISVNYEVTATQYLPPALEKGVTYYWRVKSINSGGVSAWSTTRWFALNPQGDDAASKCFLEVLFD
ncbi:MAG: hypothetical protein WC935_00585, partial [Thermoleophilia bacterium]